MIFQTITTELVKNPEIQESELLKEVCASTIAIYPNQAPLLPWAGYLAKEQGAIVGACAYKSPPVAGEVEIAYFTFPEYEGCGVATRMASYLIALAIQNGATKIKACTLPEKNASAHILGKLGFECLGLVTHPEDGEIWEWCRSGAK